VSIVTAGVAPEKAENSKFIKNNLENEGFYAKKEK